MYVGRFAVIAVSLLAFAGVARAEGGTPPTTKQEFLQRAEKTFQEGDVDGDGKLSPKERKSLYDKQKEERKDLRQEHRQERKELKQQHRQERHELKGQPH